MAYPLPVIHLLYVRTVVTSVAPKPLTIHTNAPTAMILGNRAADINDNIQTFGHIGGLDL